MRIFKYPLKITDTQSINLPVGAKVLSVQEQHGELCMWVAVNQLSDTASRTIAIIGTGNYFNASSEEVVGKFIGTVQMAAGALVWHVFDLG